MILVDSSVWVDHWNRQNTALSRALLEDQVLVHPWVLGELSLTDFRRRQALLAQLRLQLEAPVIDERLLLKFIQDHQLHDLGLGWVDCQLLASAKAVTANLWTHDKALKRTWERVRRA